VSFNFQRQAGQKGPFSSSDIYIRGIRFF